MYWTNTVRLDRAVSTRTSSRPLITLPYLTSKSFRYEQICITARVSSSSIVVFSLLDPVRANLQPHVHRVRHLGVEGVVEVPTPTPRRAHVAGCIPSRLRLPFGLLGVSHVVSHRATPSMTAISGHSRRRCDCTAPGMRSFMGPPPIAPL